MAALVFWMAMMVPLTAGLTLLGVWLTRKSSGDWPRVYGVGLIAIGLICAVFTVTVAFNIPVSEEQIEIYKVLTTVE